MENLVSQDLPDQLGALEKLDLLAQMEIRVNQAKTELPVFLAAPAIAANLANLADPEIPVKIKLKLN
jgi:hypothetical protein